MEEIIKLLEEALCSAHLTDYARSRINHALNLARDLVWQKVMKECTTPAHIKDGRCALTRYGNCKMNMECVMMSGFGQRT